MTDSFESVSDLFPTGHIRLSRVQTYNWGTFEGLHSFDVDKDGILLTGETGSGKTTLADAWVLIMMPPGQANFNAAASQDQKGRDRSLVTYVRGAYASETDGASQKLKYKRTGATLSGVCCINQADDGSVISQILLVYTNNASSTAADFNRVYIIARRELDLKEVLTHFDNGKNTEFKAWLDSDPRIDHTQSFAEYRALYKRYLYIENDNAPSLLTRALGLKRISNLTELIRDLVLEPIDMQTPAQDIVAEFSDLSSIHAQLVTQRKHAEILEPLPGLQDEISALALKSNTFEQYLAALPVYLSGHFAALWATRANELNLQLKELTLQIETSEQVKRDLAASLHLLKKTYYEQGGDQIEKLEIAIKGYEDEKRQATTHAANYQQSARKLKLDDVLESTAFQHNSEICNQALATLEEDRQKLLSTFVDHSRLYENASQHLKELSDKLVETKAAPESLIDLNLLKLRQTICADLNVSPEKLPFIGELIQVDQKSAKWRGAIERALGSVKTTLLVPTGINRELSNWLNGRHLGLHLKVQLIPKQYEHTVPQFLPDGMLIKLNWKPHRYRDWLKTFLQRFDLHCVESADALAKTEYAITKEGLLRYKKDQMEKNDRFKITDSSRWALGFSNKERIEQLEELIRKASADEAQLRRQKDDAYAELDRFHERQNALTTIVNLTWIDVDLPRIVEQIETVSRRLDALRADEGDLADLQSQISSTETELEKQDTEINRLNKATGKLTGDYESADDKHRKFHEKSKSGVAAEAAEFLLSYIDEPSSEHIDEYESLFQNYAQSLTTEITEIARKHTSRSNAAGAVIGKFSAIETGVTEGWISSDLRDLNKFVDHYHHIVNEGLPALVERFNKRMNNNMTQSMASLRTKIDGHIEEIEERISVINEVLENTDFRANTYLKIEMRPEEHPTVKAFNRQLSLTLSRAQSLPEEMRFANIKELIERLDKASSPPTNQTLESRSLLDPRFRMSFVAHECDVDTDEVVDVLSNTGGRSGGEKESFSGIIMAASLAYALSAEGYPRPIYSTVFLDEAFSNTSDLAALRVVNTFKKLGMHLNLITPLKATSVAEQVTSSAVVVEKDTQSISSYFSHMSFKDLKERIARVKKQRDEQNLAQLEALDMQVSDVQSGG